MAWADIAHGLSNLGSNVATWAQGGGLTENSPKRVAMKGAQQGQQIQREEADLQEQQQQQALDQAHLELHNHLMEMGAKPVQAGMVKDTQQLPDYLSGLGLPGATSSMNGSAATPVNGPQGQQAPANPNTVTILRPADKARVRGFKDSQGQQIEYEIPTPEEQIQRHIKLRYPAEERGVQVGRETAAAGAQGHVEGTAAATDAEREANGVQLSPEDAQRYGLPASAAGRKFLPSEVEAMSKGYLPANIRNEGANYRSDNSNATRRGVAELMAGSREAIADSKNKQADERLRHQDSWEAAKRQLQTRAENRRDKTAGAMLVGLPTAQRTHAAAINGAYTEEQKQIQAAALLGTEESPGMLSFGSKTANSVENGETFQNPFTGKTVIMTDQQRAGLQKAVEQSKAHAAELRNQATIIDQKYGLTKAPEATAPVSAAPAGAGAPAAAPPAPSAPPAAGAPGAPATAVPAGKVRVKWGAKPPPGIPANSTGFIPKEKLAAAKAAGAAEAPLNAQ